MDRGTALDLLGLAPDSGLSEVKHRFRALVHDLHPDRGGDPRAFHDVQVAYRLLCDELDPAVHPPRPRVARGRPSRQRQRPAPPRLDDPPPSPLAPLGTEELRHLVSGHHEALDIAVLARLLLTVRSDRHGRRLTSRPPGAGVLRASLLIGVPSNLTFSAAPASVHVALSARGRRARRVVTGADLTRATNATWTRQRGDAVTIVSAELGHTSDADADAWLAAGATRELLDLLRWPLRSWRLDPTH